MFEASLCFIAGICIAAAANQPWGGIVNLNSHANLELIDNAVSTLLGMSAYFTYIAMVLISLPSAVRFYGTELAVVIRESGVGHFRVSYYLGKDVSSLFRILLSTLHFVSGAMLMPTPLRSDSSFAVFFLLMYTFYGIGFFSSAVVRMRTATLLGIVISLVLSLFFPA